MKIENYYLNLDKIQTLSKQEREQIHHYYRDMIHAVEDQRNSMAQSLFNTLSRNGYLLSIRDENIEKVLQNE